jgi:hypothetical protein
MHIWHKIRPEVGRPQRRGAWAIAAAAAVLGLLGGCASPGPPLPPTLNLPLVVEASTLSAMRVGDKVQLHWTTPTRTTDKLLIAGPITAVICRDRAATKSAACTAVDRVEVTAGASDAVDTLPANLTAGTAGLLAYRVELQNAMGRSAGPSAVVVAVSGAAPAAVAELSGRAAKAGVVLEWRPDAAGAQAVELDRTWLDPPAAAANKNEKTPGQAKEPVEARFRAPSAGGTDPGGTIDNTAAIGRTYRYTVERVRSVTVGGQTLEVRSAPSAAVTVPVRDVFPPGVPTGLVAVPAFAGEQRRPAIDLSWEPNVERHVAGYRVYRRDGSGSAGGGSGSWQRVGPELVTVAAFRDATVTPGLSYAYRVTAVSDAGNESAPGGEAVETAPKQ